MIKLNSNIIKEKCVLIIKKDRNLKPHMIICEDMELAKELFGSAEKREVIFYKRDKFTKE